jgi:hypothetical protein
MALANAAIRRRQLSGKRNSRGNGHNWRETAIIDDNADEAFLLAKRAGVSPARIVSLGNIQRSSTACRLRPASPGQGSQFTSIDRAAFIRD